MKTTYFLNITSIIRFFLLVILVLSALPGPLYAQPIELRTYQIACDPDSLDYILENYQEDIYISCEFVYNGQVWHDARMRLRGDSSRRYPKKSYKINFDPSERFEGRDKVNLVSEWTDKTFAREFLSYDFFNRAGLDASRAWYAKVYLNGEYMGLYVDVEQVDEHFLARTRLDNNSSLYKASLDGAMLRDDENLDSLWEKKTNELTGFYDLYELVNTINNIPRESFYFRINDIFDREQLARHMAVNTIIGNSSTYYHNYYLVHDLRPGGKWSILPWDIDRTMNFWGDVREYPPYYFSASTIMDFNNPLVERSWRDERMRDLIFTHVENLVDSLVDADYYSAKISEIENLICQAVEEDSYKQYSVEEFHAGIQDIANRLPERGQYMINAIYDAPLPFDLHKCKRLPNGVLLTWDKSQTGNGDDVTYQLMIDDERYFSGAQFYDTGNDTFLFIPNLEDGLYYWRVDATSEAGFVTRSMRYHNIFEISNQEDDTQISGVLNSNQDWTVESGPYWISDSLFIPENITLNIWPGTHIYLLDGADILVEGSLKCQSGEESVDEITFSATAGFSSEIRVTGDNANLYLEKVLTNSYEGTVQLNGLERCNIVLNNCEFRGLQQKFITIDKSQLQIDSSLFRGDFDCFVDIIDSSNVSIKHSSLISSLEDNGNWIIKADGANSQIYLDYLYLQYESGYGFGIHCSDSDISIYGCHFQSSGRGRGMTVEAPGTEINIHNSTFSKLDEVFIAGGPNDYFGVFNSLFLRNNNVFSIGYGVMEIFNSAFYGNHQDVLESEGEDYTIAYSFVDYSQNIQRADIIQGNPIVIDAWNNNWKPQWGSPLIDAGYGIGFPGYDLEGNLRVDVVAVPNTGSGVIDYVDIGLYEYVWGVIPELDGNLFNTDKVVVYPNPCDETAVLNFHLLEDGNASFTIYNILGQQVYKQNLGWLHEGHHRVTWKCESSRGNKVASGVYFLKFNRGSDSFSEKIVVIR